MSKQYEFRTIKKLRWAEDCAICGEEMPAGSRCRWNGRRYFCHVDEDCDPKKRKAYLKNPERLKRKKEWEKENPPEADTQVPTRVQEYMDLEEVTPAEVMKWTVTRLRKVASFTGVEVTGTGKNGNATKADILTAMGLKEPKAKGSKSGRGKGRTIKGR
jgi:hypothetical protein